MCCTFRPAKRTQPAFPRVRPEENANTFDHSISESMDVAAHVGSFAAALDAAMSSPPLTDRIRRVCLGPAVDPSMTTPAALAYRQAYQRHRVGLATGASGERPDDESEMEDMSDLIEKLADDPSTDDTANRAPVHRGGGVYGQCADEQERDRILLAAAVATIVPGAPLRGRSWRQGRGGCRSVRRGRGSSPLPSSRRTSNNSSTRQKPPPSQLRRTAVRRSPCTCTWARGGWGWGWWCPPSRAPRVTMAAFSSSSSVPRRLGPRWRTAAW